MNKNNYIMTSKIIGEVLDNVFNVNLYISQQLRNKKQ